uniref:Uncharacterized protein n=1 Tax=Acrobeloides nanus TaxID=290746 RepID=A0A914EHK8_9BILA
MKFYSLVFSVFFIATNAAVLDRKYPHVEASNGTRQCSTNSSTAYVDVILVIDTSANMGNSNLRKISTTLALVLSKFSIGNQADISQGYRNTRVAVVTYDTQSTIAANFTDINSVNDVSAILNGLTASNTQQANLFEGIAKAFYLRTNCTTFYNCSISYYYLRPTAMIVFAAAANSVGLQDIPMIIEETDFFDDGTLITVNFNTADQGQSEYPFYIGLHKNQQGQWSWYDYDRTDFPVSGYSDWAQGYPNGTTRCGVMDSDDGVHLVWKNYGCNTETAGLDMVLCQSRSCDATSTYCCAYCNEQQGGGVEKKELTMPMRKFASKSRYIRRMKMINGKAVRIG